MARSTKSKFSRKILVITALAVAIVLGAGFFSWHQMAHQSKAATTDSADVRPENTVDYSGSKASDNAENNQRKGSTSPAPTLDNGPSSENNATFSVQIANSNVTASNLHVGTLISGTTSGTCTLTASQSGQQTITLATAAVQQDVNSYDCGAINIATSQFPASGSWKLTLTVDNNGQQASGTTTVTIPSGG